MGYGFLTQPNLFQEIRVVNQIFKAGRQKMGDLIEEWSSSPGEGLSGHLSKEEGEPRKKPGFNRDWV
jgi:hypothetical protein